MKHVTPGLAGALFGIGLAVSGMTRPDKIVGFLDLFGAWDPTLAFVMAGALAAHMGSARLAMRRPAPVYAASFEHPQQGDRPDVGLIAGSALFGVGWGLSGLCPGPSLVALASFSAQPVVFVVAMIAGMALHRATQPAPRQEPVVEACG
ncbi:MAG: DUF6691 family protein [Acidobacteriota bacterium]